MRIKEGFDMRNVCGEHVIIATGRKNIDFSKVVSMNESAAFLWEAVRDKEFTEADLVALLTGEYEVSGEVAAADVAAIVAQWREIGLMED